MSAQTYPVTFAYGDVDGVYYTNRNPHRGNDRPTPSGTSIVIGNAVIGYTGNTGMTSGPHLHTQAGTDEWCQSTVEPSPYEFQPGTVVNAGYGTQWGNYIIIRTGGHYICYAHLSEINCYIGQQITKGDEVIPDKKHLDMVFQRFMGRNSTPTEQAEWIGKRSYTNLLDVLTTQKAYVNEVQESVVGEVAQRDKWEKQILDLQTQVKELKAGLNKETVINYITNKLT